MRTSWFAVTGQLGEESPTRAGRTVLELVMVVVLLLLPRRWKATLTAAVVLVPRTSCSCGSSGRCRGLGLT